MAQFKFTMLLMPNGPMRITSGPFEPDNYVSEYSVQDDELKASHVTLGRVIDGDRCDQRVNNKTELEVAEGSRD